MAQIKTIQVVDNSGLVVGEYPIGQLPASVAEYFQPSLNADGSVKNIQIASPKNINIEPVKGLKIKPGESAQLELLPDKTGNLKQFVIKAWRSIESNADDTPKIVDGLPVDLAEEILCKLKIYCNNLELNNYDKVNKTSRLNNKIQFKNKDAWSKGIYEANSHDIRAYSTGDGTGGGIAVQIAGRDSSGKENKFKIETDRTVDVDATATAANHNGEGGKGIEIGTINSQMTSLYTKTYRFKANAPIYAVTRGALTTVDGKTDYPTQSDDSKDIILDSNPITWSDIVNGIKYLKSQGYIS